MEAKPPLRGKAIHRTKECGAQSRLLVQKHELLIGRDVTRLGRGDKFSFRDWSVFHPTPHLAYQYIHAGGEVRCSLMADQCRLTRPRRAVILAYNTI